LVAKENKNNSNKTNKSIEPVKFRKFITNRWDLKLARQHKPALVEDQVSDILTTERSEDIY
jgi:hypothetical protein